MAQEPMLQLVLGVLPQRGWLVQSMRRSGAFRVEEGTHTVCNIPSLSRAPALAMDSRASSIDPRAVELRKFLILAGVIGDGTLFSLLPQISWRGWTRVLRASVPVCVLAFAGAAPLPGTLLGVVDARACTPFVGGIAPPDDYTPSPCQFKPGCDLNFTHLFFQV